MRAVLVAVIMTAAVGCSTTGSHVKTWEFGCNRDVRFAPEAFNKTEQAHLVGITSMLARHGFRLVPDQESNTSLQLQFDLSTSNPWNFRSTIVLLDRGTPIVSAESVNPGWGNLIDPGGNIRAIVGRSTEEFEDELSHLLNINYLRIVRGDLASACSETEKALDGIKVKDRADAIDKFLTNRELAPIEGVWISDGSEYEIAIIKNEIIKNTIEYQSGRDFVGVVTHSQQFTWFPGQIKLFLKETATPQIFSGSWFDWRHQARGGLFFFPSNNIIEFTIDGHKHFLVRNYPKELPSQLTESKTSSGTGFFVTQDLVATNFHVVKEANQISLSVEGVQIQADILLKDSQNDLALLRLNSSDQLPVKGSTKAVKCFSLGASENVRTGDAVFTLGFPLSGLLASTPSVGQGIISNSSGMANDPRMFQISIPIQPGNSGSPLLDAYGRVIGVVTLTLNSLETFKATGSLPQNVNFAIKSSYLKSILSMVPSGDCSNSLEPQQRLTAREIQDHFSKSVVPISVSR